MEIQNIHSAAEISGIQASAFGFEMNSKMYDILISKMYTNKPAAVIRELSANAWDAHVEAGNKDKPFELHLPTWLDKTFSIRDYGTGIPHDRFEHIYTNVGKSTKEGTNELIGGFGLGSKAPFTMTDTFSVENWYGGIKTTWVCFKDKGVPQVSKLMEEPSDEPSGLKVTFSFNEGDVNEFTKQVSVQLKYFPVKPIVTGGEGSITFPALPDEWDTKDYFFTVEEKQRGYYSSSGTAYCVMGNVCYKLEPSAFPYEYRSIFSAGVVIKVPIGSVDIPPSRENLEMTPRTLKTITEVFDRIKQGYSQEVIAKLATCKTPMDVRKIAIDINIELASSKLMDMEVHGVNLRQLRNGSVYDVAGYSVMGMQRIRSGRDGYRMASLAVRKLLEKTVKVYVNDLWTNHREHIEANGDKMFHMDTASGTKSEIRVIQPPPCSVKERPVILAQLIKDVQAELGEPVYLLSSILGMPPTKAKSTGPSVKAETNQVYKVVKNYTGQGSVLACADEVSGDLPTEGFYIELSGHVLLTQIQAINQMLYHGLHQVLGKPLYFVRRKTADKLKGPVELTKDILDTYKDAVLEAALDVNKLSFILAHLHTINPEFLPILNNVKDKELKVYIRLCSFITKKASNLSRDLRPLAVLLDNATYQKRAGDVKQPSKRLSSISKRYGDINEVLMTLSSTYSSERRKARMAALKTLTNN